MTHRVKDLGEQVRAGSANLPASEPFQYRIDPIRIPHHVQFLAIQSVTVHITCVIKMIGHNPTALTL